MHHIGWWSNYSEDLGSSLHGAVLTSPGGGANLAMSFDYRERMHLDSDLHASDISGAIGCIPFPSRTSLLVEPFERKFNDDHLSLHCKRFTPEGFGRDFYFQDFVQVPSDNFLDEVVIQWDVMGILPPIGSRIWLRDVEFLEPGGNADFRFDDVSYWLWVNQKVHNPPTVKILEFFSGAFGGWKSASHHLAKRCANNFSYQMVAVEHDLNAAIAYAIGHASLLTKVGKDMPVNLFNRSDENWVAWGDVLDASLLQAVCHWQPQIVTLSPPCQPWSGAGKTKGLEVIDGMIFPQTLLACRWIRPQVILIEEVAGFMGHRHKGSVLKILPLMGYKICWQKTIDMKDHCLSSRNRWLCCAVRLYAELSMQVFQPWPKQTDLHRFEVFMPDLQHDTQLQPTAEAIRIASDPRFLKFTFKRMSKEETLKCRIYEPGTELPTFMAMYGRQHCLDESMFFKSGYLGFFVRDEAFPKKLRFWHPAEICLILGVLDMVYIDEHYPIAWQHIGNSIGIPHALLLLCHALQLIGLGDFSAFVVFQTFHDNKLSTGNQAMIQLDGGRLLCHKNHCPEDNFLLNVRLLEVCKKTMDLPNQVWSPKRGFLSYEQVEAVEPLVASQVSVAAESPQEVSPTVPFQPVLKGVIRFENHHQTFWHSADLPMQIIEQNWRGKLHASLASADNEHSEPCMQLVPATDDHIRSLPLILQILCDGELSLLTCPLNTPLCQIPSCQNLGFSLFDQFGIIPTTCMNSWDLLILPRQLSCGIAVNDLTFTIAAFSQTSLEYHWNPNMDHCCFTIKGETPAPMVVSDAFTNALDSHALLTLQRKFSIGTVENGLQCIFEPVSNHGVAPEGAFRLGLAIGLSRILLNQRTIESGSVIRIKWNGRILWQDSVHSSTSIGFLTSLLGIGLFPYALGSGFHLVNKGVRCNPDLLISSLSVSSHCGVIVLHLVPYLQGGGPGSKNQQRMLQQTALASVLLEHGYDLPWTTKTCYTLLAKFSLAKIQNITSKPMGGEKLKLIHQLCTEADISIPEVAKPSSRVTQAGTPWSNAKKSKRVQVQLDPKDFTICKGFFLNEDGTSASQLQELRPQSTGVVLASSLQAQSWIREGQLISSDELGLLILGKVPDTNLPFTEVTFPCKSSNEQMVLLTAKLIQLGSKSIGFLKGPDKKIDSETCALLAITICKEDWDTESWNDAQHSVFPSSLSLSRESK